MNTAVPVPNVQVVRPKRGEITRSITLPGNVLAWQQATLYAKVPGYLKTITVDKGDRVKQGALLAEIEVPEMEADLAKYKADVEVADMDYQRVREALKKAPDLVTPQTVDDAKGKWLVAKANLERIETLLKYASLTAPFDGVVTRRWVDPGAFIPAATSSTAAQNAAVLALADFSRVRIQAQVPEPEVPFITNGLPVRITVQELPGRNYQGRVTRYAEALDDAMNMLTEIELPNPKGELRPGMYASVQLELERRRDALTIPAEALVVEKAKNSVFTVEDGKAKKIAVKVGFNDAVSVEVVEGIKPDEPVILAGKQAINDGQAVNAKEAR
jgi:membrane fusion protein (multidrug efflux system)